MEFDLLEIICFDVITNSQNNFNKMIPLTYDNIFSKSLFSTSDEKKLKTRVFYGSLVLLRCFYFSASILYKSIAGPYRPVSYPDGPITARYRFIKNAYWVHCKKDPADLMVNTFNWLLVHVP